VEERYPDVFFSHNHKITLPPSGCGNDGKRSRTEHSVTALKLPPESVMLPGSEIAAATFRARPSMRTVNPRDCRRLRQEVETERGKTLNNNSRGKFANPGIRF